MHECCVSKWMKNVNIPIRAENIKYFTNASQKSQKFLYYLPILILINK
jgi:hypothetical protein